MEIFRKCWEWAKDVCSLVIFWIQERLWSLIFHRSYGQDQGALIIINNITLLLLPIYSIRQGCHSMWGQELLGRALCSFLASCKVVNVFGWAHISVFLILKPADVCCTCEEFESISRLKKTNICSERDKNTDGEMSSCLSCVPFKPSSRLAAQHGRLERSSEEEEAATQTWQGTSPSLFCSLPLSRPSQSVLLFLPLCCWREIRWSSTGCSVCWGRRKRRGGADPRPAPSPQWVWRKWNQRYQQLHGSRAQLSCTANSKVTENQFRLTGLVKCDNNVIFPLAFPHLWCSISQAAPECIIGSSLSALSRTPTIWGGVNRRALTPTQSCPTTTTLIHTPTPTTTTPGTTACSRTLPARAEQRWRRRGDSSHLCPHQAQTFPAFPPAAAPPYPVKSYSQSRTPNSCADRARSVCRHKNGHCVYVLFFSSRASRTEDRLVQDRRGRREDNCMSPSFSFSSEDGNIFILNFSFFSVSIPLL